MHLFAQYFRCHISWCSAGIQRLFAIFSSRDAEICQSEISEFIKDEVLWFDIPVEYFIFVYVLYRSYDAGDQKFSLIFSEFSCIGQSAP